MISGNAILSQVSMHFSFGCNDPTVLFIAKMKGKEALHGHQLNSNEFDQCTMDEWVFRETTVDGMKPPQTDPWSSKWSRSSA